MKKSYYGFKAGETVRNQDYAIIGKILGFPAKNRTDDNPKLHNVRIKTDDGIEELEVDEIVKVKL